MDLIRKGQSKLVHRNVNGSGSPGTEAAYPLADNSQEHIYTYDNDKNRRSVPNTPGRKAFKIICIILFIIGIYLVLFSLFISLRGGFSGKDLNDINSNCRYAMAILAGFVIFVSFTGYSGAYTNWKPIILTFSILASMAFLGHMYVAKKLLDATRFTQRDMAISWWDVYTDPIRMRIEDQYSCCGYMNYNDLPVASQFCSSTDVDFVTQYASNIKNPADVLKNDSYRKKFSTADSVVDSTENIGQNQAQAAPAAAQAPAPVAADPAAAPVAADPAPAAAADPVVDPAAGNIFGNFWKRNGHSGLVKRQESHEITVEDLAISQAPGCKDFLVPLVKNRLKFMYVINYACCIAYLVAVGISLYYWQNMRKEKEFDEFA